MTTSTEELVQRLSKLERQVRIWRASAAMIPLIVAFACLSAGPARLDTLRAQRFIVIDADGNEAASFGMNPLFGSVTGNEQASLLFLDHRERESARIDQAGVFLNYSDGTPKTMLSSIHGTPTLSLMGETRATLIVPSGGRFEDANGHCWIGVTGEGVPKFAVVDPEGRVQWEAP